MTAADPLARNSGPKGSGDGSTARRGAGSAASRIRVVLGATVVALVLFTILFLLFRKGASSGAQLSPLGIRHTPPPTRAATMLRELPPPDRSQSATPNQPKSPSALP